MLWRSYICTRFEGEIWIADSRIGNVQDFFWNIFLKLLAGLENGCIFAPAKRMSDSETR
ncbi:hypothetical protein C8D94_1081, partial [Marinirhabdus gelatinilytica]